MEVLKTLQYMKNDIKVMVWENDIDRIEYNELEEFRPTKAEILAVDQALVEEWWDNKEAAERELAQKDILEQINILMKQYNNLKE